MAPLPAPSPDARRHGDALAELIRGEIAAAGGWLPFARYMELALYAPGLGYYSAGAAKFGAAGDFVTAPELSPLFGRVLARQSAPVLAETGGGMLELGAGSGRLAVDAWRELERLGVLPEHYAILDVSGDLRERQRAIFAAEAPALLERARWLDVLPERLRGVVLANEVLDAIPVHRVAWREEGIFEQGVEAAEEGFRWAERPAGGVLLNAARALPVAPEYASELNLAAPALVRTLGERLEAGMLLFVDYGFGRREFYHPQRSGGTLLCHYRHHVHDDPFFLPGLQDITAHVDFTAVAEAGVGVGLDLLGYTSQARFLLDGGLLALLGETDAADPAYAPLAAGAQKLLSPAEMGELFKVIGLGRGVAPPSGLASPGRLHSL